MYYYYKWFSIITTTNPWKSDKKLQETAMRNHIITRISVSWGVCFGDVPCITSRMRNSGEIVNAKFAYSPIAQEWYKKVDFAEKNRALIEHFRETGATIVDPPQGQ